MMLDGMSFCFTGGMEEMSRRAANALVRSLGGTVSNHVCAGTDYLVAAGDSLKKGSTKMREADILGITVIGEREFMEMVG